MKTSISNSKAKMWHPRLWMALIMLSTRWKMVRHNTWCKIDNEVFEKGHMPMDTNKSPTKDLVLEQTLIKAWTIARCIFFAT
jgi:hypothetical protein